MLRAARTLNKRLRRPELPVHTLCPAVRQRAHCLLGLLLLQMVMRPCLLLLLLLLLLLRKMVMWPWLLLLLLLLCLSPAKLPLQHAQLTAGLQTAAGLGTGWGGASQGNCRGQGGSSSSSSKGVLKDWLQVQQEQVPQSLLPCHSRTRQAGNGGGDTQVRLQPRSRASCGTRSWGHSGAPAGTQQSVMRHTELGTLRCACRHAAEGHAAHGVGDTQVRLQTRSRASCGTQSWGHSGAPAGTQQSVMRHTELGTLRCACRHAAEGHAAHGVGDIQVHLQPC